MKLKHLIKEIKGVFKAPRKRCYLGRIKYGCPYFSPPNFLSSIFNIRKLIPKTEEQLSEYIEKYPHLKNTTNCKYSNFPMIRRNKYWIKRIFNNDYYIQIGYPISVYWHGLGWKDKFDIPRYEWSPAFFIFFFNWQFCIWWNSPDRDNDQYYEQILWYLEYSNKDISKAKETWPWTNYKTKQSTWNDKYLI